MVAVSVFALPHGFLRIYSMPSDAEYAILRTEAVVSVPRDVDPAEAAPLLCAGVTTFNSLRHMDILPGEIVAVQGIGGKPPYNPSNRNHNSIYPQD